MSQFERDFLGEDRYRLCTEHKAGWTLSGLSLASFVVFLGSALMFSFQSLLDINAVIIGLLIIILLTNFAPFSLSLFVITSAHYYNKRALLILAVALFINVITILLFLILLLAGTYDVYQSAECSLGEKECLHLPLTKEYCGSDKEAVCARSIVGYGIMFLASLVIALLALGLGVYAIVWRSRTMRRVHQLFADNLDTHYEMDSVFDQ